MEAASLTFGKVVRDSLKAGYRDGADEARQKNYQPYFDRGYEEGFQSGFQLGMLKAQHILGYKILNTTHSNLISASRRGACVLCEDKELDTAPLHTIIEKQKQVLINTQRSLEEETEQKGY